MLWVFKYKSCKFIHFLSGPGTKLGLINSIFIFAEFISVDNDNLIVIKAKVSLEEINGSLPNWISGFVGSVDCID